MRNITIGYIPVIEIQKQINTATLRLLQRYSEVLETNDAKAVEDFLFDASQKNNSNRMDLHGNGFKVSACVLASFKSTVSVFGSQFNQSNRIWFA